MSLLRVLLVLSLALCLLPGCATNARFPVDAELHRTRIETTVDSRQAQYYLNHYLQGQRLDTELDDKIFRVYRDFPAPTPDRDDLKRIADRFSNDFAALFLADRLWRDLQNRKLQLAFHRYVNLPRGQLFAPISGVGEIIVLLVPGWDYVENGHITGSNFAAPRRLFSRMGIANELVQVPPTGSVMQSAEIIAETIQRHSLAGRKIIVVGASAAGPAIHYTLGSLLDHRQAAPVLAWVNIGGILQGSPLIDYFQQWPQKALLNVALVFLGWDNDQIMTLSAEQTRQRSRGLQLPDDLLVVNYIGLSLSGSLSRRTSFNYPILSREGPNDGLTPLADIIAPGSLTLIAPDSDHYFNEDPLIDIKTVAMLKTVLELTRNRAAR